ncbi:MAG TPA: hypothetical protein VGG19_03070 [Tepidisphaeraceae bacterium]|jgi:hypothetical protein
MAKAKKTESASLKKPAKKASGASSPAGFPSIDTNLAAESAARMLLRKPSANEPAKKESGAFKNLKESVNSPSLGNLDQFMNTTGPQRSGSSHQRDQQKGHSQTSSANVARTGVPRRTPG